MDPFTLAIVEGALIAASDEMFEVVKRTSYSPIIYEVLDYATGITDNSGRLVVQGNGVTGFLGSLSSAVQEVLLEFPQIRRGDVFIVNDPYRAGGTHLSDVTLVRPFFADEKLIAFGASKAHWTELGGARPGSWSTDAVDVFAEGLHFPLMKLAENDVQNSTLLRLLTANVRTPTDTMGDMQAQYGALRIGERRLEATVREYGLEVVQEAMAAILTRGERAARRTLKELPRGTFVAEDFLEEGDGLPLIPVKVAVTIDQEQFTVDFSGSSPAVKGTINATWPSLECGVRTAFRALMQTDEPTSDGMFSVLNLVCPPGTVFTAVRPMPVSTYWEASDMSAELVQKALAPIVPRLLPAGHSLSVCASIIAFADVPGEEPKILVEPQAGGWGGSADEDGESALVPIGDGDTCSIPAEVLEFAYPVEVISLALNRDLSGGHGRHRGGFGLIRKLRLKRRATLTASYGRHEVVPWGVLGGADGTPNYVEVWDETGRPLGRRGRYDAMPLAEGSIISLVTGVGGGNGSPSERAPRDVMQDIEDGFLTVDEAKRIYGASLLLTGEAHELHTTEGHG